MPAPLFVRPLKRSERRALEKGLRSTDAFSVRRCQILLASAQRRTASQIAQDLHCAGQTVRNVLREFEQRGLDCLIKGANVPLSVQPVLTVEKREQVRAILHQSPRTFGKAQSFWTLKLLAKVCYEQHLSDTVLSAPTILDAIVRLGSQWKRAKHWVTSPDPLYTKKKTTGPSDLFGG